MTSLKLFLPKAKDFRLARIRFLLFFCSHLFLIQNMFLLYAVGGESAKSSKKNQGALENSSMVLVPAARAPEFSDDADLQTLQKAIQESLTYYDTVPADSSFFFGKESYAAQQLVRSLKHLQRFLEQSPDAAALNRFIRDNFLIYRSVRIPNPTPPSAKIIFSAYHECSLKAALTPDFEYRYPIYGRPQDLVDVPLENFEPSKKGERIVGRVEGKTLFPYYTRKEIDSDGILKGKGLEIAWAKDPLDILFLQIQGSGWLQIPESTQTFHIRYAGDNGKPFRSVGTYLIESGALAKEGFSRAKMAEHLAKLSEEKKQFVLNQNPRYIFFEIVSSTHLTRGSLLVSLTPGRSIATDPKIYPRGALAWMRTEKPWFDSAGRFVGTKPLTRFVLNQDEGGAIKGPGRVDFFVGGGEEAERTAQKLWNPGELYFFILKEESARQSH